MTPTVLWKNSFPKYVISQSDCQEWLTKVQTTVNDPSILQAKGCVFIILVEAEINCDHV